MLRVILEEVCSLTGESVEGVMSKNRMWPLMYARYLYFDVATRLGVRPTSVVCFISRNRTMVSPYTKAVNDLIAVDPQFRKDREELFNLVKSIIEDDTA